MERDKKMPPRIRLSDRIYGYRQSAIENYLFARTA
jgi:predicted DNA-binding transcriptional regulator AlpA